MNRLEGKVAIITGGGGGIGGATARRFASEGARVVVADLSLERDAQVADGIGAGALALHLDAADEHACQEVVERTWREFGRTDLLHYNPAGLTYGIPEAGTLVATTHYVL